jgi:hypothetical protein
MTALNGKPRRSRAVTLFECEKAVARAQGGMVSTNQPLAAAAGVQMLAAGGNAMDAAVGARFTLTVVELESGFGEGLKQEFLSMSHGVGPVPHVGRGMNAVASDETGHTSRMLPVGEPMGRQQD